ncbi:MAG: hypothetical protein QMD01_07540 [Thermodesulfovibrionales bacterium]|nr:hypothetical protein [Thermodesulfovibrionales bacterium]
METLKMFDEKIAYAIEKIRVLKEEKNSLENKIKDLENTISLKNQEIDRLTSEKTSVKNQIEDLLKEIDSIELK